MEGSAPPPPPAGWYRDPDDEALQRFWNGSRWTNSRMPVNTGVALEGEPHPEPQATPESPTPAAAEAPAKLPPAAWYADPENATGMRYWDGAEWTEHRTNYRVEASTGGGASDGLVIAGYVLSFLVPIAGLVIGAILLGRNNQHGRWILALSILFIVLVIAADSSLR